MKPIKLLYTSTFHLALIYMVLFASSVLLLLSFIYWATAGYLGRQIDATIEAEIAGLAEQYQRRGVPGLMTLIRERVARSPNSASLYLFAAADYTPLAGNLSRWPPVAETPTGWINFALNNYSSEGEFHPARAKLFVLRGELHLLVGRDIYEFREMQELILNAFSWGLAMTLGLALVGGLTMSWSMMRRLEVINQICGQIMRGDLARRIPVHGTGDEFDQLADNLNAMLDQIERLMVGIRQVSDNIAHDLRTPLSRLRYRLEQVRWQQPGTDYYEDSIEQSIADADQLLFTFNALLRIAQIESGSQGRCRTRVELETLVRDAAELYEALAEEHNQDFELRLAPGLKVQGDRDLLFQAVANLLDNAVKYTPSGGKISVMLRRSLRAVEIVVADTGLGIPVEARERVLERFYRLEASRSTPGSGLGLSLVAAVATLHEAELRLEDNGPGLRVILAFGEV